MPKEMISIEIENSGYKLVKSFAKIGEAVKQALADGWQPGQDLPVIVTAAISELGTMAIAVPQIAPDAKEDLVGFIKGVNLGAYDIADIFVKKV